ncbi:hypothetical protein DFP73DRAFT_559935 [Morchella snyderi]|nr:hypothetical protein DFP73DRAFT_559935 [Morchella snyderi]
MAPLTRAHRAKASRNGEPIEPLSPALPLTSTPTPRRNHTRFDEDDAPTAPAAAAATTTTKPEEIAEPQTFAKPDSREIADSQENSDASDSDDEAPEETSLGAGKEEALKRDEEARKAAEAQKDAARKKRKERDTQLKTQKAGADARKRQRLDEAASQLTLEASNAIIETEAEPEARNEAAGEDKEQTPEDTSAPPAPIEKAKLPKLLPESLLTAVASRPEEDSDSEDPEDDTPAPPGQPSKHLEKNRRRREQKRRNKVLKKGVVSVKVFSDDAETRKNLAPPVVRNVGNIKEAWLYNRRGGVERRAVGRGFVRN